MATTLHPAQALRYDGGMMDSVSFLGTASFRGGTRVCLLSSLLSIAGFSGVGWGQESQIRFNDVAEAAGIRFQHHSPLSPERHIHLFMGSGLAWTDYDRDGRPDLFFCQGRAWNKNDNDTQHKPTRSNQLFRNLRDGTFTDVTQAAGFADVRYSMGVAVGDYDNDGFSDLYVSNFGRNAFYRNNGDGTFTEQAAKLGLDDERYGASCTWADIDGDGNLDLFVVNYLKIDRNNYPLCHHKEAGLKLAASCHPRYLPAEFDILYHNEGDGRFTDVSQQSGLRKGQARQGLGIIAADLDGDNDVDFYVANDSVPNQLWVNQGDGTFRDRGILSGTAVNRTGRWEAGMGVVAGDVDGDGRFDLFVTNYFRETNTLYRNEGANFFLDVTDEVGLAAPSRLVLSFGTSLLDADNDGWLDLFVANGHVQDRFERFGRNEPFAQLPQFFRNDRGRRFQEVSRKVGDYFRRKVVGRGSAAADFDRDGRCDLAVLHLNGAAALLRNESESIGKSLQVQLVGISSNRDAIGAVVEVTVGKRRLLRSRIGSSSYLSCDEGPLLIGIGESRTVDRLSVRWPSGRREHWPAVPADGPAVPADGPLRLIEGTGVAD